MRKTACKPADLVQASEKGWGAVAHYLKAVAKQRGWRNESHRDFFTIESRLARETDNPDRLHSLFSLCAKFAPELLRTAISS